MRHTRYDGADIRRILAAMVTDSTVCGRISSQWIPFGLFKADHANLIGQWCVDHFRKYGSCPNSQLESIFEEWAGDHPTDNDLTTSVERFLSHLSDEHEQKEDVYTSDYLVNLASKHFNKIRLEKTIDQAQLELDQGNVEDAQNQLTRSKPIELGLGSYIEPADDYQVWDDAFSTERRRPLVTYPGALGKYFDGTFNRGELYAFLASDKCGKTTWLIDFAYRVIRKRNKVVFFDTGDGDQDEVVTRLAIRSSAQSEYNVKTKIPIEWVGDNLIANTIECRGANPIDAYRSFIKVSKASDTFRISCHANSTISVEGIDSILERWSHDGWRPSVVCIAEGSLVLTNRGLIPIEKIKLNDKLWDGVNWVKHEGLIYKGIQNVIEYAGITATPEHKIWTEDGWRSLESCRRLRLRIANTEQNGRNIRVGENYITNNSDSTVRLQKVWENLSRKEGICLCSMCAMQFGEVDQLLQHSERGSKRLSKMHPTKTISNMVLVENSSSTTKMSKSKSFQLEELWWKRNRILIPFCYRSLLMANKKFRFSRESTNGNRSYQQQWSLRTGKYSMVYQTAKYCKQKGHTEYNKNSSFSTIIPRCDICRCHIEEVFSKKDDTRTNFNPMEIKQTKVYKSRVWDIRNCGPLHRFTVQGILVHNCIDYADILAPPSGVKDKLDKIDETWKQLRRLSQQRHCLVMTATQASALIYGREKGFLGKQHFSGRKTINAVVNGMVGINVSDKDRARQEARLKWVVQRKVKNRMMQKNFVTVAGCYDIGNPIIISK